MEKKRLEDLAVGDKVYRRVLGSINIYTILKTTKTQIIIKSGSYRKKDGRAIGNNDAYNMDFIRTLTPVIEKEAEVQFVQGRINKISKIKVTEENYIEINNLLDQIEVIGAKK